MSKLSHQFSVILLGVLLFLGASLYSCASSEDKLQSAIANLASSEDQVRNRAALALGKLGAEAAPAVTPLSKLLHEDKNWTVRNSAAYALKLIGTPQATEELTKALPVYQQALISGDLDTRRAAAEGLGYFGAVGKEAAGELGRAVYDPSRAVADAAAYSIQKLQIEPEDIAKKVNPEAFK